MAGVEAEGSPGYSGTLLLLLRVLSTCDVCSVGPQDAKLASPPSPNLIHTKNEGRCVALVAYRTLIHIKKESHLGMDGTRGDGSRTATLGRRRAAWTEILLRSIQG
ncbi:Mannitol-1-phosphate 5-dehydrogenase [Dissostichus eleginoides]|uniref:Mannitol-1-phosphate 5-dehydrogenase n=1 Tax=Dissostichus eleginoides TaxID=100907 RepID=A0AAD9BHH8_DISEL|nr:Mannitol-1-phosphate 5-dehydrogenase [Dissostichus eleginoides]